MEKTADSINAMREFSLLRLREIAEQMQRDVINPITSWRFAREVSAKRMRRLKKRRGWEVKFSGRTSTGKPRYLCVERSYIVFCHPQFRE